MPPLPSLASHKPGLSGLRTGRGEGKPAGLRERGAYPFRRPNLIAPDPDAGSQAGTCAHSGAGLVSRKTLKSHIKTLM